MSKISIMQGRLSPPFEGRFQAFPASTWEQEFFLAKNLNLYSIEWIYEKPHEADNPLFSIRGIKKVKELIQTSGVQVKSICADYYMSERLIDAEKPNFEHWEHLKWLFHQASELGINYIILPFVDGSSIKNKAQKDVLAQQLSQFLKNIDFLNIELHLEMDLHPAEFLVLIQEVNHPLLKMNYDTGNSASLGYDPNLEFSLLGKYLGSVHIKDRLKNGGTVLLGTGNTDFRKCFFWFERCNFNRWYVLQAARNELGVEVRTIEKQIEFLNEISYVFSNN